MQDGFVCFSRAVNCTGRAAVQRHQMKLDGTVVQSGLIHDPETGYLQTSIEVNQNLDVLVGFQETSENMFISPRMAFGHAEDPPGTLRETVHLGEGPGSN